MKKLFFLLIALSVLSCQNEENMVNRNNDGALSKTSPLTSLILRTSQNPTAWDNLLDGSDCTCVKLPVGITLNGDYMWIDSESDYYTVWANMYQSTTDDDIVHFEFPITVSFKDFSEQVIANQTQFDAMTCESDGFNEIRCMDFLFPIAINTYNTGSQIANTITLSNNAALYNFVGSLGAQDIFTIVYPVTVTFGSGSETTANSNTELENIIESVIPDCDTGWGQTPDTLDEILASGTWHISYCENDDSEPVHYYNGYNFTFNQNGTVTAVKNSITGEGLWNVYQDGSHEMIDLYFPASGLNGLANDEWRVIEYNAGNVRLKNDQSSWDGYEYVYFTKN